MQPIFLTILMMDTDLKDSTRTREPRAVCVDQKNQGLMATGVMGSL